MPVFNHQPFQGPQGRCRNLPEDDAAKALQSGRSRSAAALFTAPVLDYAPTAVIGSITLRTSSIRSAGKPLFSACLRTIPSSFAR